MLLSVCVQQFNHFFFVSPNFLKLIFFVIFRSFLNNICYFFSLILWGTVEFGETTKFLLANKDWHSQDWYLKNLGSDVLIEVGNCTNYYSVTLILYFEQKI